MDTGWLTGLWYTQAKVKGTVLKAARNWGSNSSVVNGPHVEPGRTPLYIRTLYVQAFRPRGAPWTATIFSPC